MADTVTPNYNLVKPEIGSSIDTWGNKLNSDMDKIDNAMKSIEDRKLENDGDTYEGLLQFRTTPANRPSWFNTDPAVNALVGVLDTVEERNAAIKAALMEMFPTGTVIKWAGTAANVPTGWRLCDGTNGTPNMMNRFALGASATGAIGGTWEHNHGGLVTATALAIEHLPPHSHNVNDPGHAHSVYDPGHSHYYETVGDVIHGAVVGSPSRVSVKGARTEHVYTGVSIYAAGTGIWNSNTGAGWGHQHGIPTSNHAPPYYGICFIMKVW